MYVAGKQTLHDGTTLDLPPILFGVLGEDKKKKTLLVYGHLDVQPAAKEDGWNTEPFELVEKVTFKASAKLSLYVKIYAFTEGTRMHLFFHTYYCEILVFAESYNK